MGVLINKTLNTNNAAGTGAFTTLERFEAAAYSNTGDSPYSHVQVTLDPATASGNMVLSAVWIGHAAVSGDAYDFDGGQVQLTFGGSTTATLVTSGGAVVSDLATFAFDPTRPVIVAYDGGSGAARDVHTLTGLGANFTLYFKNSGGGDAATTNKASGGYGNVSGRLDVISKIEAFPAESSAAASSEAASSERIREAASSSDHKASHDAASSDAAVSSQKRLDDASSSNAGIADIWNIHDKTANVSTSDTDHLATLAASGVGGIRATHGHNTGRRYFEIFIPTVTQLSQFNAYGIATAAYDLSSNSAYGGNAAFRAIILGLYGGGGHFTMSNNTLRFAVNFVTKEFSVALNNGAFFPPSKLDISSLWFPAVAFENGLQAITATLNAGDRPFGYSIPIGFEAWNAEQLADSASINIFDSIIIASGDPGVSDTRTFMKTVDAVHWTAKIGLDTSAAGDGIEFKSLAHSSQLNKFVGIARVAPDTSHQIVTSPDGEIWTAQTSPENNHWESVCWSDDLRLFVAVASNGTHRVMTSPDGVVWTVRTASSADTWGKVLWASAAGLFMALAQTGAFMTSPDGTNWTGKTSAGITNNGAMAYSETQGRVSVLGGQSVGNNKSFSDDSGTTWTTAAFITHDSYLDMCWSPDTGQFLAVGNGFGTGTNAASATSPDGTTWTGTTWTGTHKWSGCCWARALNLFIIVGGGTTDYIATSPDGAAWTPQTPPLNYAWDKVIEGIIYHESPSSEFESMIESLDRASSDKAAHDAASSDLSDKNLSDAHLSDRNLSDKRLHDAASSSDAHLSDAHLSDRHLSDKHLHDAQSSDKLIHDAESSSDKLIHDAQSSSNIFAGQGESSSDFLAHAAESSEFQSDITHEPPPPIQVIVIVST